jgi:hypothetical protein
VHSSYLLDELRNRECLVTNAGATLKSIVFVQEKHYRRLGETNQFRIRQHLKLAPTNSSYANGISGFSVPEIANDQ